MTESREWGTLFFTQSARRHRVGKERARFVIDNANAILTMDPPTPGMDDRIVFLGQDPTGRELEVVGLPLEGGGLLVIHLQDLQSKFRHYYKMATEV